MNPETHSKLVVNFSSRTRSKDLQLTIDDNIDKRGGRIFGPKLANRKLVVFVDDIHMPTVDKYGTQ